MFRENRVESSTEGYGEKEPNNPAKVSFITRHSKKSKGEDAESKRYPGISEKGVELAEERAEELAKMVEESAPGSVIFIGGASEMVRTKSTAEAYGDKLKDLMKDQEDVLVMTRSGIREGTKGKGYSKAVKGIVAEIEANPDKKIVIDFPMFLKQFSMIAEGWFNKDGKPGPFLNEVLKRNNGDEYAAFRNWLETRGNLDGIKGPDPEETAKNYKKGLDRLRDFAEKQIGDRPLVIGTVGHSWDIDAFLTYLAEGKVDLGSFDKVSGGGIIKETEIAQIIMKGGSTTVSYRGKEFNV